MRPLEWLFFLSFLPGLILPYLLRSAQQRRWLIVAALLPPLACLPHFALEGWRTQMIPLYLLGLVIGAIGLWSARGKASGRRKPNKFLSALLVLAVLLGGVLPGWVLPVPTLAQPTGRYNVGRVDRELMDNARGRKLMVSIWYPAAQSGPPANLTAYPDAIASGLTSAFGVSQAAPMLQQIRYITVAASEGAPIAAESAPFPVLVFSHGLVGSRIQNSPTMQELASWGYVVVALDHTDAAAVTVFPDGETRLYDLQRLGISPTDAERSTTFLLPIWVADQRFVYDQLAAWAATDPLLAGRLDLERLGSFGHSFGGATSLEVCRVDQRCRAAVNLDGGVSGDVPLTTTRPLLLLTSTASNDIPEAQRNWSRLIDGTTAPASWVELADSNHYSFTILPLLSPVLGLLGADTHKGLQTVDRYLRAFFDLHLRGIPTPLLTPTAGDGDVRWHSR